MADKKEKEEVDWKKQYDELVKRHNSVLDTLALYGLNIQIFCNNGKIR
jgi:hypothetical protein